MSAVFQIVFILFCGSIFSGTVYSRDNFFSFRLYDNSYMRDEIITNLVFFCQNSRQNKNSWKSFTYKPSHIQGSCPTSFQVNFVNEQIGEGEVQVWKYIKYSTDSYPILTPNGLIWRSFKNGTMNQFLIAGAAHSWFKHEVLGLLHGNGWIIEQIHLNLPHATEFEDVF